MANRKPKIKFYNEETKLELKNGIYYLNGRKASEDEVRNIFIELGFKRIEK